LLNLKTKIEGSKSKVSELTGQKNQLLESLKSDYNCVSVEQAQAKLLDMDTEIRETDSLIKAKVQELEETYLNNN
ncbi:MAG TPA: hypothetical protein VMX17_16840, partial [Candidatus Glassbacteria bacterium]|nr:hypothetical protein [Candidatus Glassbacteria bacterium]